MATTQYIGARYVPLFAEPLDWNSDSVYEALTIVYYAGNSYTSRQAVPKGIDITNEKYWALTGNYNAQIEAYRKEVKAMDGRVTENAQKIADEVTRAVAQEAAIKSLVEAEATRAKAAEKVNSDAIVKEVARAKTEEASINEDINSLKPSLVSEISSVAETETRIEFNNDKNSIIYDANYSVNFNTIAANPLAILQTTSGYRTASALEYSNEYTATNVNEDYSGWEPARNHPTTNGKYAIDCTTLAILVMNGILYSDSTYSIDGENTCTNKILNMFSDTAKNYIGYESYHNGEEVEAPHRRLLAGELAKLLYDAGKLQHIENEKIFFPGDVLFLSNVNTSRVGVWEYIGHCAIYVCKLGDNHIVIDASTNRGGINSVVNYHVLTSTELSQIKWKFTIPQYTYPLHNQFFNYSVKKAVGTSSVSQTFSQAGCALVHNTAASTNKVTITYTFPDPLNDINYSIDLGANNSHLAIVPPGVKITVVGETTGITLNMQIGGYSLLTEPYRP